jgi:hypothetical protein
MVPHPVATSGLCPRPQLHLTLLTFAGKLSYSKNQIEGCHNHVVAYHTRFGAAFSQASRKDTPERPYEAVGREII